MSIVQHRYNKIANYCEELRRMVKTQKPDNSRIMKHGGELRISLPLIPDDENAWRKRPVKSRVCGLKDSMVRQEYDKINPLNGLK